MDDAQLRMRNSLRMGLYINVAGMLLALVGAEQIVGTLVAKVLYSQGEKASVKCFFQLTNCHLLERNTIQNEQSMDGAAESFMVIGNSTFKHGMYILYLVVLTAGLTSDPSGFYSTRRLNSVIKSCGTFACASTRLFPGARVGWPSRYPGCARLPVDVLACMSC